MQDKEVKDYFERDAERFDNIYDNKGDIITRVANRIFRKGMKERFDLTVNSCFEYGEASVLDIGCGAGRFLIPLARKGLKCTGIDYSEEMIKLAKEKLKEYNNETKKKLDIKYKCSDFLKDYEGWKGYDITLAIGVFDYLKEPLIFLKRMKEVTNKVILASFPAKFVFQTPIRKIWLMTKNCPVYFYTKKDIANMCKSSGIKNYKILNYKDGYLLKANLE